MRLLMYPLNKVRVQIVDKVETPTVAFFLDDVALAQRFDNLTKGYKESGRQAVEINSELCLLRNNYDAPKFLSDNMNYLKYVVITCNSSDWPQNITLPFNQ